MVAFFKKYKLIIPLILVLGYFSVVVPGYSCVVIPPVKVDLETLVEEPMKYKGKRIETSGKVVTYPIRRRFRTWHFFIEKDEKELRCYERRYRVEPSPWSPYLRLAKRKGEAVTVNGRFCHDGIELSWIIYKDIKMNTDYVRPRIPKVYGIPSFAG